METPGSTPTQQVCQHHQDEKDSQNILLGYLLVRAICKNTTEAGKEVLSYHSFQGQTYSGAGGGAGSFRYKGFIAKDSRRGEFCYLGIPCNSITSHLKHYFILK